LEAPQLHNNDSSGQFLHHFRNQSAIDGVETPLKSTAIKDALSDGD